MNETINLSNDFLSWIKVKNPNDYWYVSNVPDDYAIRKYNSFNKKLKSDTLECKQVTWFVTNKCDLACEHCGVSANERKFSEVSIEQFTEIIPTLKKIGVQYITLSGGEPLIRKDISDIFTLLKMNGFKVGMVSNGSKLKSFLKKHEEFKLDTLSISIDGLEENHSQIRKNKSNFKKALEGIKHAKNAGVNIVAVHTCVYPNNIDELEELKDLVFSYGVDQWIIRPVAGSGRAAEKSNYFLSNEQIKDLLFYAKENIEKGYDITVGGDLGYLGKLDSYLYLAPYFCSVGWDSMIILPNGDMKGFDERALPVEGNILTDDIENIWKNKFQYYRNPNLPELCTTCKYFSSCYGGYLPGVEIGRRCIKPVLEMLEADG